MKKLTVVSGAVAFIPIAPLADDFQLVFYDQRMTGLSSREFSGEITLQSYFMIWMLLLSILAKDVKLFCRDKVGAR